MLSKNTVEALSLLIRENIARDVRKAEMYSVQIDTTQDVTCKDQCSVLLRYVADQVYEKLIAILNCNSTSVVGMIQLIMDVLSQCNISNLGPIRIMLKYIQDLYAYFVLW